MQDLKFMTPATISASAPPPRPSSTRADWYSARALARAAVTGHWIYALLVALWLLGHAQRPESTWWLSDWAALPGQLLALMLVAGLLLRASLTGPRRHAWRWVAAFIALNIVANVVWNALWSKPRDPGLMIGDLLYLLDYLVLGCAFACFYLAAGGSLRRPQFWRDVLTINIALLAALWAFLFAPFFSAGALPALSIGTTIGYAAILSSLMAMAAMTSTQVDGLGGQEALLLLVLAAMAEAAWEFAWLAGELTGRSYVGLFYNYGDVICFALVATAVVNEHGINTTHDSRRSLESSAHGFLPALSVLVAVALLAASASTARSWGAWVPAALVLLVAATLVARQRGLRAQINRLNHALAVHDSDARLTELARRSDDLIVVMNEALELTFVSPASQAMLGAAPEQLKHTSATAMLGAENEATMKPFLHALRSGGVMHAELEATLVTAHAGTRFLQIAGTNQLHNRLIGGIALTLRDVTEHRTLEREIIDVAARERLRLCSDIHEGLGQELSGIALLLHCAAANPQVDPQARKASLETIVGHVNRTIESARGLAEELSPIHIARGSLATALARLTRELAARTAAQVSFTPPADEHPLDLNVADHLYRIAKEATGNAVRHSGCTLLRITLDTQERELTLAVTDNGRGMDGAAPRQDGLGLRMMNFRARAIGGTLRIEPQPEGGTRLSITVPLPIRSGPRSVLAGGSGVA